MPFTKKAPKMPYIVTFLMLLAFFITHTPRIFFFLLVDCIMKLDT